MSRKLIRALFALPLVALAASAAHAVVCPMIGASAGCSALITRSATGVYTVVSTGIGPYDGNDDSLVGFVNNGPDSVASLKLSGNDIFGFDGDGIDHYTGGGKFGPTGYEGPQTSFTVVDVSNGTVSFTGGVAAGATAYFALESNLSNASGAPITVSGTPEPGSWALMFVGFAAVGATLRRRTMSVVAA